MPIGAYIVDFACFKVRLIVELDGVSIRMTLRMIKRRSAFLNDNGWKVIRFWNNEFRSNEEVC
ncbi:endonuclease domain-containing protein [Lelliottia amnigena]|uniref:endonuclease domain-containing protein n=1 Tax=Lelliottia amnigena TaxID=61646 RepID=UPI0020B1E1A4|nr:DUF559 domain-containing protein [Lelliottia amnigena]